MKKAQLKPRLWTLDIVDLEHKQPLRDYTWCFYFKQINTNYLICYSLERSNKRGWTFFTYGINNHKQSVFFSRSEWDWIDLD